MFHPQFHVRMLEKRVSLSLTQVQAARCCGMTNVRWSELERGVRLPSDEERRAISGYLEIENSYIPPRKANRTLLNQAQRNLQTPRPFFPAQDRGTHIRYRACAREYPELVDALAGRVMRRGDLDLCEYFGHRVSCDSRLECLYLLHLLARGARTGLLAPSSLGHTRWPIVDCKGRREVGFRPRPCLLLDETWYFPQVSFATPRVKRVDFLCWKGGWRVLEINGRGHDSSRDSYWAVMLDIPHTYMSEKQLLWEAGRAG